MTWRDIFNRIKTFVHWLRRRPYFPQPEIKNPVDSPEGTNSSALSQPNSDEPKPSPGTSKDVSPNLLRIDVEYESADLDKSSVAQKGPKIEPSDSFQNTNKEGAVVTDKNIEGDISHESSSTKDDLEIEKNHDAQSVDKDDTVAMHTSVEDDVSDESFSTKDDLEIEKNDGAQSTDKDDAVAMHTSVEDYVSHESALVEDDLEIEKNDSAQSTDKDDTVATHTSVEDDVSHESASVEDDLEIEKRDGEQELIERDSLLSGVSGSDPADENSTPPQHKEEANRRSGKAPYNIGSKRDRARFKSPVSPSQSSRSVKKRPDPEPELVCRENQRLLEIIVSLNQENIVREVRHNDQVLEITNGECILSSFTGCLSISHDDGSVTKLPLFDRSPFVFKLPNWSEDGHQIPRITIGKFIVITPQEWERESKPFLESAGCRDPGFRAHYFEVESENDQPVKIADFQGRLAFVDSYFRLAGESAFDNSEEGELFVHDIPRLIAEDSVIWARVGEERRGGWSGVNFKPHDQSLAGALEGRQGSFFARVYSVESSKQLDSGPFRYFQNLREVLVGGESYNANTLLIPAQSGHQPVQVRFSGANDATIRPTLLSDAKHAEANRDDLVVAPHPDGDYIACNLESEGGSVKIEIVLPRIWWRLEQRDADFGDWLDTALVMSRDEFRGYADAGASICLRLPLKIKSVEVGFDEESGFTFPDRTQASTDNGQPRRGVNRDRFRYVSIPLSDFVDHSQIDQRLIKDSALNVRFHGITLSIVRVSPDPLPKIVSFTCEPATLKPGETATLNWESINTDPGGVYIDPEIGKVESKGSAVIAPESTERYTLNLAVLGMEEKVTKTIKVIVNASPKGGTNFFPEVRTLASWRQGKGFSRGEFQQAGFSTAEILRLSIPYDKRRRSVHSPNVEKLKG